MSVSDGVISLNKEGKVIFMNPLVEQMTGVCSDVGFSMYFSDLVKYKFEYNEVDFTKVFINIMNKKKKYNTPSEIKLIDNDDKEYIIAFTASPIKTTEGEIDGVVIVFRDVTKEHGKIKEIEYFSYHDHLTGLYNRHYLETALTKNDYKKYLPLTIMVIDVNGLKLTNDAFGHQAGDKIIKVTSDILKEVCREKDVIARVGGDEFAIIMPNTYSEEAKKIKENIIEKSNNTKLKSGVISLAVGYAVRKHISKAISTIFKEADNQMYRYKAKSGKMMRSQTIETVLRSINNKYDKE